MCGIYGIWNRDRRPLDLAALESATATIRHRGPDDEGYLLANAHDVVTRHFRGDDTDARVEAPHLRTASPQAFDFAFGFRRLSIVDLSPLGHQPMSARDGR